MYLRWGRGAGERGRGSGSAARGGGDTAGDGRCMARARRGTSGMEGARRDLGARRAAGATAGGGTAGAQWGHGGCTTGVRHEAAVRGTRQACVYLDTWRWGRRGRGGEGRAGGAGQGDRDGDVTGTGRGMGGGGGEPSHRLLNTNSNLKSFHGIRVIGSTRSVFWFVLFCFVSLFPSLHIRE